MSYQALSQSEAEEGLPRYSGDAAVIGISSGTSSNNSNGRASNYLHISDGKRITGTHHINTDLLPLAGRFDNAEDRDKTPNVYLEAKYIDVELVLSGSKKAKIVISDPAHSPGTNRSYSRHIIRITHGGGDASIAKHGLTLFDLEVDQYSHGRAVVSVEPRAFTGFVNGSFKLSEEMQKIATCVVSRPGNSRWLVSRTGSIPTQAQGESTSSSEPTASTWASDGDDTTLVSNLATTCSSILFKNGKEKEAAHTCERRIVCSTAEYEESRAEIFAMERYYVRVWFALAAVWFVVLAGIIYIGLHAPYGSDGQMHGGYIAALMVGGIVLGIAAVIMLVAPIV